MARPMEECDVEFRRKNIAVNMPRELWRRLQEAAFRNRRKDKEELILAIEWWLSDDEEDFTNHRKHRQ